MCGVGFNVLHPLGGTAFAFLMDMTPARHKFGGILLYCVTTIALAADQTPVQSHDSIRDAAKAHVLHQLEHGNADAKARVEVGKLDYRLKLGACSQPIEAYDSPNGLRGGRGVVGVRCDGNNPWKIYVPIQVSLIEQVVVSARPLAKGHLLSNADLRLAEMDVSRLRKAYYSRPQDIVGQHLKRQVAAGATLHAGLVERGKLVTRGGQVEILAGGDGLQVRMRGKALADGSLGDRIRVKNLRSGRVLTATVTGGGIVQVTY